MRWLILLLFPTMVYANVYISFGYGNESIFEQLPGKKIHINLLYVDNLNQAFDIIKPHLKSGKSPLPLVIDNSVIQTTLEGKTIGWTNNDYIKLRMNLQPVMDFFSRVNLLENVVFISNYFPYGNLEETVILNQLNLKPIRVRTISDLRKALMKNKDASLIIDYLWYIQDDTTKQYYGRDRIRKEIKTYCIKPFVFTIRWKGYFYYNWNIQTFPIENGGEVYPEYRYIPPRIESILKEYPAEWETLKLLK